MTDGTGAATALAALGLDGSPFAAPAAPLSEAAWDALVERVVPERLWFLLGDAVAGHWPATDEQVATAVEGEERAATQVLALDRDLLELAGRFDAAGVDYRVLKGPAHAHGLWRRRELRFYSDVDVVVHGRSFDRAAAIVEADLGGHRHTPDPRTGFTARVGKSATFTLPDGVEVDLHRTLVDGPFGASILTDDLFEGGDAFPLGRRMLPSLSRPAMFVHACLHAFTNESTRRLVALRDVAEGLQSLHGDEQAAALDLARRWRCRALVARAVRAVRSTFRLSTEPVTPLVTWAAAYEATALEQAWVVTLTRPFPGRAAVATAAMVPALRTWSDRRVFALGVVAGEHRAPWPQRLARLARR